MNDASSLNDYGFDDSIAALAEESRAKGFEVGRILCEQKERYSVFAASGEYDAEITGNLRFTAQGREDFPAVGDWVMITPFENNFAIIHSVLPRYSMISRSSPEKRGEKQIIAANIDYALIVQAADRDFNLNRLERYLAICGDSHIQSMVVLTKIDLFDEARERELVFLIQKRVPDVPIFSLSNETHLGLDALKKVIVKGKTYCLLGSSGVGKSTLLNNLFGKTVMETGATSESTNKGRHTTSYRELIVLDSGGILIDNPGMREVGMTDSDTALDRAFSAIAELAPSCKFTDCTHTAEKGCAVLHALEGGSIDKALYENFLKMEKEKIYFESTAVEKRQKDKDFGKMIKNFKKEQKANKFT